jgi:hypothetical protein
MKWMRERDLLIAQTMAFVQSVTGKRPDLDKPGVVPDSAKPGTAATPMPDIEALLTDAKAVPERPKPLQVERPDLRSDFQSEIRARVANFRAHQERFHREREEYCSATMAKVRAALRENSETRG